MIPGMPRPLDYNHPDFWEGTYMYDTKTGETGPVKIRVTKLDAAGNPAGPPMMVTGSARVMPVEYSCPAGSVPCPRFDDDDEDKPYPERVQDWVREALQQRADALNKMVWELDVPPHVLDFTDRRRAAWNHWEGGGGVVPQFMQDELDRDEEHARQVRAEKKLREQAYLYADRAPASAPPVSPIHEHYVVDECGKGAPMRWEYTVDKTTGMETWRNLSTGVVFAMKDGLQANNRWCAPPAMIWDEPGVYAPELQTVNHPCTLAFDTGTGQQEEGTNSMFSAEAQRIAAQQLLDERENRAAEEIISRIKAFGEDTYADGTVLRFSKQFYKSYGSTILAAPDVWAVLRQTDDCGNTIWAADDGSERTWDELISWLVTEGKPVTLDDIEVWPPAKFPADDAK